MNRVQIDPNIRVEHNWTLAGVEDCQNRPVLGEPVTVYEPESGLTGTGRIEEIEDNGLVVISVDWAGMVVHV